MSIVCDSSVYSVWFKCLPVLCFLVCRFQALLTATVANGKFFFLNLPLLAVWSTSCVSSVYLVLFHSNWIPLSLFLNEKLRITSQKKKTKKKNWPRFQINVKKKNLRSISKEGRQNFQRYSDLQVRFLSSVAGCRHPVLHEVSLVELKESGDYQSWWLRKKSKPFWD